MEILEKLRETAEFILKEVGIPPEIVIVLGSGLGDLVDDISDRKVIPYSKIPHFPKATVEGHAGNLVVGSLAGKKVLAMQGRFHYYEGFSMDEVVYPMRVFAFMKVKHAILTNAAGGIGRNLKPGDIMLIRDHLSLFCENPLRGKNFNELGARFPDMSDVYSKEMRVKALNASHSTGVNLKEGIYCYTKGPSYETPFEIRLLKTMGVDAVGMSTVPEAIVATHGKIEVLALSCITNLAAGLSPKKLSHEEVIETANKVKGEFKKLIKAVVDEI